MFLRRCERRKSGKRHVYWALVESYRTAKGSRQRVVAYLGELKASERSGWAHLGKRLRGADKPRPSLFEPPAYEEPDEEVLVQLRGIRLERLRDFGDVWLAWGLWRLLGLDALLTQHLPRGREDVPWASVAALLVIARFCEPASELHIEHTWYRRTALDDLLGVAAAQVHSDRLYGGLDRLLPLKEVIEKHMKERLGQLFDIDYDLLLYDVTSTYFEGEAAANPLARRGYSRDSRPDRPQVCIGLVVTRDGLPLGYEVFAGNRNDATTVRDMVLAMEAKYGRAGRIWVMDRGMVSEANLRFLRERGGQYIMGTPKALLRSFERELTEEAWQTAQEGVEVKLVEGPEGEERFVLTRSADRRLKEQAMHERFVARLEAGLQKLQQAAARGRLRDEATANRRLGRLLEKNWRAAKAFVVRIEKRAATNAASDAATNAATNAASDGASDGAANTAGTTDSSVTTICQSARARERIAPLRIDYERDPQWTAWAALADGCYILRTNVKDMDAAALWKHYIQLTEAEWAFRITKDELRIRPIWHQRAERVQAHILVCFLAYVLWKTLGQWMRHARLGDAPRTLVDELAKIKSGDVVLPARSAIGAPRSICLRCVTEPDAAQKVLLARLGVALPRRLRRLDQLPAATQM